MFDLLGTFFHIFSLSLTKETPLGMFQAYFQNFVKAPEYGQATIKDLEGPCDSRPNSLL